MREWKYIINYLSGHRSNVAHRQGWTNTKARKNQNHIKTQRRWGAAENGRGWFILLRQEQPWL